MIAWSLKAVSFVLPSGEILPLNFGDLVNDLISYSYGWDWLLPMQTLYSVLNAIILFLIAEFAWKGGRYVLSVLRGN